MWCRRFWCTQKWLSMRRRRCNFEMLFCLIYATRPLPLPFVDAVGRSNRLACDTNVEMTNDFVCVLVQCVQFTCFVQFCRFATLCFYHFLFETDIQRNFGCLNCSSSKADCDFAVGQRLSNDRIIRFSFQSKQLNFIDSDNEAKNHSNFSKWKLSRQRRDCDRMKNYRK